MMIRALLCFGLLAPAIAVPAQRSDTLRYRSAAFGTERTVVVHLPTYHRYASAAVRLPVIVLLDGQHEWFTEPVLNDIHYLQYTHEVPQAIVVTIPLVDRVAECAPDSLDQPPMPLVRMLANELPALLEPYHPADLCVLVGHSFSSSFALYAFLRAPAAFDAVIALSPAHHVREALPRVARSLAEQPDKRVLVAVGGAERSKDGGHHALVTAAMRGTDPEAAGDRFVFRTYPNAGHSSLPIIAVPDLLTTLFLPFALRDSLCPVDDAYHMIHPPPSPEELLRMVERACAFPGGTIPWEVAEINGLASRLYSSGYMEHATAIYRHAIRLYPTLYEFHASLGELLLMQEREAGLAALREALRLLDSEEKELPDRAQLRSGIEAMMRP